MKVLKIIHTLGHGGAENTFRWLAWGLRQEGLDVIAAIPRISGPNMENWIEPALKEQGIPTLTFDNSGSAGQLLRSLMSLIEQVGPDIVHSHLMDSNFYTSMASRRLGVPHVGTEHGDVSFKLTAASRIKFGIISLCSTQIICVSGAVMEKASRVVPFKSKLRTVYNGIRFLEKVPSTFRTEFGVPNDAILAGNVGNLYPIKGQRFLVSAFAQLLESCPDAYLALVGRGDEECNLRAQARELNIPEDRVLFTGFRKDIENVMNAFDLYVQPSLSEGHPIAVLEAMSLGIPVIASAVGGIPEVIGPDRYGTLVAPESSDGLQAALQLFLDKREAFANKARAAKLHARDEFSIEKMSANYIKCYKEALAACGR